MLTAVGVDGCKGGWIAVTRHPGQNPTVRVHSEFSNLLASLPSDAMIAVDMPMGLPLLIEGPGRVAEQSARSALGMKKSSVFSIPSRIAVYADLRIGDPNIERSLAYRAVCLTARQTSTPSRAISIQSFSILPKIREIDQILRANKNLMSRVHESHPELAFCVLNQDKALASKKTRGPSGSEGLRQRRDLLASYGFEPTFLNQAAPSKAGADDFLDACVMMLVASRIASNEAQSFPKDMAFDAFGIPIAIRV